MLKSRRKSPAIEFDARDDTHEHLGDPEGHRCTCKATKERFRSHSAEKKSVMGKTAAVKVCT